MRPIYFWENYLNNFPLYNKLVDNYGVIKEEILNYLQLPDALFDYPMYLVEGEDKQGIPLYENYWKAIPMTNFEGEFLADYASPDEKQFFNFLIERTKRLCPFTNSIIEGLEKENNLKNCFISRLLPGSIINPHRGWTDDFMRIHLGLVCDSECKITVGEETKTWEEGKIIAFKDGGEYLHSVKHLGKTERIILSMDIRIDYLKTYVHQL
jgi:hypothetical protein